MYHMNMKISPNDISNQEILEAMNSFASSVENRFDLLEKDVAKVKAVMVTKDYLDDKLADLHSNIIQHTRKEIEKALR